MADRNEKSKAKRLPRGQRKHARRQKQAARHGGTVARR